MPVPLRFSNGKWIVPAAAVSLEYVNGALVNWSWEQQFQWSRIKHAAALIFSMVRQTGEGLSIAVDYLGRTTAAMDHFTTDDHVMIAHVPRKGTTTLYALIALLLTLAYHLVAINGRLFFTIRIVEYPVLFYNQTDD